MCASHLRARFWLAAAALLLLGCGTDVDLGGTADGGAAEDAAKPPGDAAIARCDASVAPQIAAACHACAPTSAGCQPNGCFGGYWCDIVTKDCQKPPGACP